MLSGLFRRFFPRRNYAQQRSVVPTADTPADDKAALYRGGEEDEVWTSSLTTRGDEKKKKNKNSQQEIEDTFALAADLQLTFHAVTTSPTTFTVRYDLVTSSNSGSNRSSLLAIALAQMVQVLAAPSSSSKLPPLSPSHFLALSQIAEIISSHYQAPYVSSKTKCPPLSSSLALLDLSLALLLANTTAKVESSAAGSTSGCVASSTAALEGIVGALLVLSNSLVVDNDGTHPAGPLLRQDEAYVVQYLVAIRKAAWVTAWLSRRGAIATGSSSSGSGLCAAVSVLGACLAAVPSTEEASAEVRITYMSTCLLSWRLQRSLLGCNGWLLPSLSKLSKSFGPSPQDLLESLRHLLSSSSSVSGNRVGFAIAAMRHWLSIYTAPNASDGNEQGDIAWLEAILASLVLVLAEIVQKAHLNPTDLRSISDKDAGIRMFQVCSLGPVLLEAFLVVHRAHSSRHQRQGPLLALLDAGALQLGGFLVAAANLVRSKTAAHAAMNPEASKSKYSSTESNSSSGPLTSSAYSRSLSSGSPTRAPTTSLSIQRVDSVDFGSPSTAGAHTPLPGAAATKASVMFCVGDRVDGLCTLSNGSKRWYPAIVASTRHFSPSSGEILLYTLRYNDGDIGTDMQACDVRVTKSRIHGASTASLDLTGSFGSSNNIIGALIASAAPAPSVVTSGLDVMVAPLNSREISLPNPSPSPILRGGLTMIPTAQLHVTLSTTTTTTSTSVDACMTDDHAVSSPGRDKANTGDTNGFHDDDSDNDDNVFEIPSIMPITARASLAGRLSLQLSELNATHYAGPASMSLSSIVLDANTHASARQGSARGTLATTASGTYVLVPEYTEERLTLHSASTLSRPPSSNRAGLLDNPANTHRDTYTHRSNYTARGATPNRFDRPPSSTLTQRESYQRLGSAHAGSARAGSAYGKRNEVGLVAGRDHDGHDDSGTVLTTNTVGSQNTGLTQDGSESTRLATYIPDSISPYHFDTEGTARLSELGEGKEPSMTAAGVCADENESQSHALLAILLRTATFAAAACVAVCCGDDSDPVLSTLLMKAVSEKEATGVNASKTLLEALQEWLPVGQHLYVHTLGEEWGPSPLSALYLLCGPPGRRLVTLLGLPPVPSVPQIEGLVGDRLGFGAHGSVHRVDVPLLESTDSKEDSGYSSYAVKRLPRSTTDLSAVFAEVSVMERLAAPDALTGTRAASTLSLVSFGVLGESFWLIMPRGGCSLTTLRQDLQSCLFDGSTAADEEKSSPWLLLVLELFLEASFVIAGVHERCVIHFDVKADNFLLTRVFEGEVRACLPLPGGGDGDADALDRILRRLRAAHASGHALGGILLLADFGESVVEKAGQQSLSGDNGARVRGTLPIQSPEMLALNANANKPGETTSGQQLSPSAYPQPSFASDCWSLVLLGVEAISGRYLYADKSWAELYVLLCLPSQSIGVVFADLPALIATHAGSRSAATLISLLSRLLVLDPRKRPTAKSISEEVEAVVAALVKDHSRAALKHEYTTKSVIVPAAAATSESESDLEHMTASLLTLFSGWLHLPPASKLGEIIHMLPPRNLECLTGMRALFADADVDTPTVEGADTSRADAVDTDYEASFGAALVGSGGKKSASSSQTSTSTMVIKVSYPGADADAVEFSEEASSSHLLWIFPFVVAGDIEGSDLPSEHKVEWISALSKSFFQHLACLLRLDVDKRAVKVLLPPAGQATSNWDGCYYPLLPVYLALLLRVYCERLPQSDENEKIIKQSLRSLGRGLLCDAVMSEPWVGLLPPQAFEDVSKLHAALCR